MVYIQCTYFHVWVKFKRGVEYITVCIQWFDLTAELRKKSVSTWWRDTASKINLAVTNQTTTFFLSYRRGRLKINIENQPNTIKISPTDVWMWVTYPLRGSPVWWHQLWWVKNDTYPEMIYFVGLFSFNVQCFDQSNLGLAFFCLYAISNLFYLYPLTKYWNLWMYENIFTNNTPKLECLYF